ncbi:hypothetical protein Zmor_008742 [Zophobas morio]|uniref:L-type lectin-like domain-containing protein n=1 Tax=Zophobas morio TaxID=2755281 RepID=A0AA38M075_9CUCU|nr:hypothetical protein Zmor_008742 [Zophobas morio]
MVNYKGGSTSLPLMISVPFLLRDRNLLYFSLESHSRQSDGTCSDLKNFGQFGKTLDTDTANAIGVPSFLPPLPSGKHSIHIINLVSHFEEGLGWGYIISMKSIRGDRPLKKGTNNAFSIERAKASSRSHQCDKEYMALESFNISHNKYLDLAVFVNKAWALLYCLKIFIARNNKMKERGAFYRDLAESSPNLIVLDLRNTSEGGFWKQKRKNWTEKSVRDMILMKKQEKCSISTLFPNLQFLFIITFFPKLWNKYPISFQRWQVLVDFQISGDATLGADGMAFWYTEAPLKLGPVYGGMDQWKGLAVVLDTYNNDQWVYFLERY